MGDFSSALQLWEKALELEDGHAKFHKDLSSLYFEVREYENAWNHVLLAEELGAPVKSLKQKIQTKRTQL